jgi:hypothetical protein
MRHRDAGCVTRDATECGATSPQSHGAFARATLAQHPSIITLFRVTRHASRVTDHEAAP